MGVGDAHHDGKLVAVASGAVGNAALIINDVHSSR